MSQTLECAFKEVNVFSSWAWPNVGIFDPFVIEVRKCIQYRRAGVSFTAVFQLQYSYVYATWNSFENRSKWASVEIYLRRFSTAFRTATVENTHGCFQRVREAAVRGIFAMYLGKQMWRSPFKVKLWKNSKNSYFPEHAFVSLFRLVQGLVLFFFKNIEKSKLLRWKSCEKFK